jgi:hypothetical protein
MADWVEPKREWWQRRMDCLEVYLVKIRRQPPVRIHYCLPPLQPRLEGCVDGRGCRGEERSCLTCCFTYCADCYRYHAKRLRVPPDAWRGFKMQLLAEFAKLAGVKARLHIARRGSAPVAECRVAGQVRHVHAPAIIAYCSPPATKNVALPCAYPSRICGAGSTECPWCFFTFCDRHLAGHAYRFALPKNLWLLFVRKFEWQLDHSVGSNRIPRIRVRVPSLRRVLR